MQIRSPFDHIDVNYLHFLLLLRASKIAFTIKDDCEINVESFENGSLRSQQRRNYVLNLLKSGQARGQKLAILVHRGVLQPLCVQVHQQLNRFV